MKKYELWLDESGDFEPESEKNAKMHPSLAGGILVESGMVSDKEITELLDIEEESGFAHAMDMGKQEMADRVLPALEKLHRKGAKLVYFENAERVDIYSSKELYLRLLAGGLVQLMQRLAAVGEFTLDIMIAVRYVETGPGIMDRIHDDAYINMLRSYVKDSWKNERLHMSASCRLNMTVLSARQERRLQLADFACNARLTRHSGKFDLDMRLRLEDLFEDDFIYSVMVNSSENMILANLAANSVTEALMEFYTGHGSLEQEKMLELILDKLSSFSYDQASRQLEEFSVQIVSLVQNWADYEHNEAVLKEIDSTLFPRIQERGIDVQTDEAKFRILYCLCDMFITEGDLLHAKPVLEKMRDLLRDMNYRIENIQHLYYYNDRKALYEIASLDFAGAVKTIDVTIRTLQNIIDLLDADDVLRAYLGESGSMRSEMMVKACTMKLYALIYMQRLDASVYEREICPLLEKIRRHCSFPGEMRRALQYSASAEMEAGHIDKALQQLLQTELITGEVQDRVKDCIAYLDRTRGKDPDSRAYNMMYYVQLMEAAVKWGHGQVAEDMQQALERQIFMRDEMLTETLTLTNLQSDVKKSPVIYEDILQGSLVLKRRKYHPLELVNWKYGAYLAWIAGPEGKARDYFERAILICGSNQDYSMLHLIAIAVRLERFCWSLRSKKLSDCVSECRSLQNAVKNRRQRDLHQWPESMRLLIEETDRKLRRFYSLKEEDADSYANEIYELSQAVPF